MDDVRPPLVGYEHAYNVGACEACTAAGTHIGDMATPETTFVNRCPHVADGTALCLWMAETGHWPKEKPVVHSMNPVGAARMRGIIDRYFGTKQGEPLGKNQSR